MIMRAKASRELLITPEATTRSILMAALIALALVTCTASGFAADALRGKQFAGRVCVICHVVFKGQSPGDPNAPSFRSVAKSRQFREKGVRLLWETHPKMPNLALTQEESEDVAAYIKSLAR
jgi:mono/diheme cytochrome c family protein